MALGPDVPEFRELARVLERLAVSCGATNAVVLDAWYDLWCRARVLSFRAQNLVLSILQRTGASRLMIVDRENLVGVVSLKDMLRFLALKIDLEGKEGNGYLKDRGFLPRSQ